MTEPTNYSSTTPLGHTDPRVDLAFTSIQEEIQKLTKQCNGLSDELLRADGLLLDLARKLDKRDALIKTLVSVLEDSTGEMESWRQWAINNIDPAYGDVIRIQNQQEKIDAILTQAQQFLKIEGEKWPKTELVSFLS